MRRGDSVILQLKNTVIRAGDILLLCTRKSFPKKFSSSDLLILSERKTAQRALTAAGKLAAVGLIILVAIFIFTTLPGFMAAFLVAALLILFRVISLPQIYAQMNWQAVFLVAGMIPLGTALETSGLTSLMADAVVSGSLTYGFSSTVLFTIFFFITSGLSQVMSNTASTILLAPVVVEVARSADLSVEASLMVVATAASSAFLTPIGTLPNLMVMSPGGYRFSDYLRVGLPLYLITAVISVFLIPMIWG